MTGLDSSDELGGFSIGDYVDDLLRLRSILSLLEFDDLWTNYLDAANDGRIADPDFDTLDRLALRMDNGIQEVAEAVKALQGRFSVVHDDALSAGLNVLLEAEAMDPEFNDWLRSQPEGLEELFRTAAVRVGAEAGEEVRTLYGKRGRLKARELPDSDLRPMFRCALTIVGIGATATLAAAGAVATFGAGAAGIAAAAGLGASAGGWELSKAWSKSGCPEVRWRSIPA